MTPGVGEIFNYCLFVYVVIFYLYNSYLFIHICSGTRVNAEKTDLSEILPEEVEEEVKAAAEISMGTEVDTLYAVEGTLPDPPFFPIPLCQRF